MAEERPNPDELLAEVKREEARRNRGKLKIFFGMAAGVGKTYAMLEEARARAAEGLNVLVGYAEPHIRTETEALLLGMEILPYRIVQYRGAMLKEFDLDGVLTRKPALVLVDELAHTNAPGLRHPKRWQDVVELLDAGINVYTTMNVQHLESVNDIVEHITGVQVRETLPDSVLEQADEVELVDIAPEELLERFREGKVYRPDLAEQAARHFFTPGNLIALRELALRTVTQRVDAQMLNFRRQNRIRVTWPTTDRIIVCISPSPLSIQLVRAAKRLATGLKAQWIAAYVETPAAAQISARDAQRVERTLRLAEQLGAQTVILRGENVAEEIVAYAYAHNATKIVIGKPLRARWRDLLLGSVVDDLVRHSGDVDVYVIRGEPEEGETPPAQPNSPRPYDRRGCVSAVIVTAIATAIGWPLYHGLHWPDASVPPHFSSINVLMIYLLGVLWIATRHSRFAAVLASLIAVAAFDFCFVPPYLTFTVADQQYLLTFMVMLLTALTISSLTHRVRRQADAARQREHRTQSLLDLARALAGAHNTQQIAAATTRHVREALGREVILLLPGKDHRLVLSAAPADSEAPDDKEMGVAQWAFEHEQPAGCDTATLPAARGTYLPLKTTRGTVGIIGLTAGEPGGTEQRQLLEGFASQAALAIERATLAEEARQAWERVETELVRNTLLSGVSHELRTPLAAITGAASTLADAGSLLSAQVRDDLLRTIHSEADRMDRLVSNLLDMTRLEAGGLTLRREWQPLEEVVGSALHHLERRLNGREISVSMAQDLPLIHIDAVAIEQVLANLLDNAAEYTPAGTPIDIEAHRSSSNVVVEVADRGPGLPPGAEKRVFDKFFRIPLPGHPRGIGLGLAISRGIVEAHGGQISAANREGGGAVFRFTIPLGTPPSVDASA